MKIFESNYVCVVHAYQNHVCESMHYKPYYFIITNAITMKITIQHQATYSRGELLLRTFFGVIYMILPHVFLLLFIAIGAMFVNFIAFWAILFTGNYPRGMWNFMVNIFRWTLRLTARMQNLSDGYPAFGLKGTDDKTILDIAYPDKSSRGLLLLRAFFGVFYILIPHGFCLLFLSIAASFVRFIAFWAVLFTGAYPKGMHDFVTGVVRWGMRVNLYYTNLTDTYPPFTLENVEEESVALDHKV